MYPGYYGAYLDFSSTTLTNISEIEGSNYGDAIKGNGQYVTGTTNQVPIIGGSGNDKFFESGPDIQGETYGADQIDGGGSNNIYYANGTEGSYTPEYNLNGTAVLHSGTNWLFKDAGGCLINLTNVLEVDFSNQTLYSTSAPTAAIAVSSASKIANMMVASLSTQRNFVTANLSSPASTASPSITTLPPFTESPSSMSFLPSAVANDITSNAATASALHADLSAVTLSRSDITSSANSIAATILGQGTPQPELNRISAGLAAYIMGAREKTIMAQTALHAAA